MGPVLGPRACTNRTRDTQLAEPRLPAPKDGRLGEGQRLTADAPHNGGRHPPWRRPPASPTTSNAPTHQRTSHGTSAPYSLLLGTGRTRGPTQKTPPISDAGRSTRGHQGAGTQRRHRRPPTRGRGHGLHSGGNTGALHGKRARGTCAAGGQRAHPLPRVETRSLHRRRLVPQNSTLSPAPMAVRCPRLDPRTHAPPYATGWRRAGSWLRQHAAA